MNNRYGKGWFLGAVLVMCHLCSFPTYAQYRSQETGHSSAAQSLVRPGGGIGSILGLIDPDNFFMRHNFSFSYFTGGGTGLSLASYTNSMLYRIADPLDVRVDLTLQGSPFGQYGQADRGAFNKLFISRAELNYRPLDNMFVKFQYRQLRPGAYGLGYPYYPSIIEGDE